MPLHYDIYCLSENRNKKTIEEFLDYFSFRNKIENRDNQEISIIGNKEYNIKESWIPIRTISEVIDYGIENSNIGFAFYIGDNLKKGISHIILKFTFDKKMIFGICVQEERLVDNQQITDNYKFALEVENTISKLTDSKKTSIQFENPPADDEVEFDESMEVWRKMNEEKSKND
jgi:hypothetical protein